MAIPTLIPSVATLPDSSPPDHPHQHVSLGLGADETACGEDKLGCLRMEAGGASPPKKARRDATGVEMILRQTAEIGMVLVGMAALRGGAPPTPVECHLAVKAYSNLEGLVERVAPRDLVSKKSLQSLLQQFSVSQQPVLPRASTPVQAQDVSTSSMGASAIPASAKQPVVPLVSTPIQAQDVSTSSMGASAIPASAKPASTLGKRPRVAVKTPKQNAAAKRGVSINSITRSKDPQSVPNTGTSETVRKGPEPRLRGRGATIAQPLVDQRQVHREIALEVQLLKPDAFMEALSETASAYISSPIRCDTCKVLINDTSSVLICDGCDAGFHLLCLQMYKPSDIPEKDWYCTKCEAMPGSQPRQSKYGPIVQGPGRRGSRTTWVLKVLRN